MSKHKGVSALFNKLAQAERNFFSQENEFLTPVYPGIPIKVKIEGVIMTLLIENTRFVGWGICRPTSQKTARFIREATLAERRSYLDLLPSFIGLVYQIQPTAGIVISNGRYKNVLIDGKMKMLLGENLAIFDRVLARWDGVNFWYDEHSLSGDLSMSEHMRRHLAGKSIIGEIDTKGWGPGERLAYELAYEEVRDKTEDILAKTLRRSGAKLIKHVDRGDSYTVTYTVSLPGGRESEHTSTIDKDLRVRPSGAGICLNGGDANFDLQSLIHVIREGETDRRIVRVGNNAVGHPHDDDMY